MPYITNSSLTWLKAELRKPYYAPLDAQEERRLIELGQAGDKAARDKVIASCMRFAFNKVNRQRHYREENIIECAQETFISIGKAFDRFQHGKGSKFLSFAAWYIKAAINSYRFTNGSIVKRFTSQGQRITYFNLRKLEGLTDEEAAATLQARISSTVTTKDVAATRNLFAQPDVSMQAPMSNGPDGDFSIQDRLPHLGANQEEQLLSKEASQLLRTAFELTRLTSRERNVIQQRFFAEPTETLISLGKKIGVSRESVRQTEAKALGKIKETYNDLLDEE